MKFEGKLEYVKDVVDVVDKFKQLADLSKPLDMSGQYTNNLSVLEDLKDYGENLVSYAYLGKTAFLYRSIERDSLLVDIKGYRLTISYIGTRIWFIHFLKKVGLYQYFDDVEIETYELDEDIGFKTKPHHFIIEGFVQLPLEEQRTIIQGLVTKAANNGEDGDFVRYGAFKTSEDEQGVGWFVTSTDHLKGDENNIVKHYFNSKQNSIRINTLKEFMALSKSVKRVKRHI